MKRFNPSGPVQSLLVVQDGEFFRHTTVDAEAPAASRELAMVAGIRRDLAARLGLETSAIFPYPKAEEVVAEYRRRWLAEPEQLCRKRLLKDRCASPEDAARTMASNFRTHCFHIFGGKPWLLWFVAIGDVPHQLVQLANLYWSSRVRALTGREPRTCPHPQPKLSAPALAASRGEKPVLRGVRHTVSAAKAARKERDRLIKQVQKAQEEWHGNPWGRGMSWSAWRALLARKEARRVVGCVLGEAF